MGTLVAPGVSVSVTDQSFFVPVSAPTVPLLFVATEAGKTQVDGITPAAGTLESNVVRTVTSLSQSLQLYGVPSFRADTSGNQFHGDSRNEYGVLALNQFLGIGNVAYVVRADVDLTDASQTYISLGTPKVVGSTVYNGIGNGTLNSVSATDNKVKPQLITVMMTSPTTFTVTGSLAGHIGTGTVGTPFSSTTVNFLVSAGSTAFASGDAFSFNLGYAATPDVGNTGNGTVANLVPGTLAVPETLTITFTSPIAFTVNGTVSGAAGSGTVGANFDNNRVNFTITAGTVAFVSGDSFTIVVSSVTVTSTLGANDAAKRLSILTALRAAIVSNTEVRSAIYEYNLILCPGYPEVIDDLLALAVDVKDEAFVIADAPANQTPEQVAQWGLTSSRFSGVAVAYYYPWGLVTNMDGVEVLGAASGIALRTFAYSDNVSYLWEAPAGTNRGLVTGVSKVGYFTGTAGTATTFVEANLTDGQVQILYQYDTNINPIVFMPGVGLVVWGQKTSAPAASARDRINVEREIRYIARSLRKAARPFVFEPNDQITRGNLKAMADGFLSDLITKRGLYDFATLCDESNNTPARIDRNELWLNVAIKPVKAAEFIYIPINVVNTGASLTG